MAQAAPKRPQAGPTSVEERAERLREIMTGLSLAAVPFTSQARVEEMARHWLTGGRVVPDDERFAETMVDALRLALDVALFTPSASGSTAIDRFARQHKPADADERAALAALQRATFRILRFGQPQPGGGYEVVDLATNQRLRLVERDFPAGLQGLDIAARTATIEGDAIVMVGPVTPLDGEMRAIAEARMRPGGRGLTNPNRCAEAIYRHAVRYGMIEIPGLNRPDEADPDEPPFLPEDGPLHELAFAWAKAEPGAEPSDADIRTVRELVSEPMLIEALSGCAAARERGKPELAAAYERILTIQMETIERRGATGVAVALASLDAFAAFVDRSVGAGLAPPLVKTIFEDVRRRIRVAGFGSKPARSADAELDKVLARIQALRAKTVDRGCTEQEAIAAAQKVAELLDRHGLSLSEVELKNQTCEGFGVDTGRRRYGPIDSCIPTVAKFCDCRVWSEQTDTGEIRYVFFGMPADVAGARYLYELVERAFETETKQFKRGDIYLGHRSGDRHSATRSFQTGLAHGIANKLRELRDRRDTAMRDATGRNLVPVKEAVIDDELAKLGLSFHTRGGTRGRYVLPAAYKAGQEAGDRFEYRPGIADKAAARQP